MRDEEECAGNLEPVSSTANRVSYGWHITQNMPLLCPRNPVWGYKSQDPGFQCRRVLQKYALSDLLIYFDIQTYLHIIQTYLHIHLYVRAHPHSFKNSTGAHNCTTCDASSPLTLKAASVAAHQCVAEEGDELYEKPEFMAPVVVGPAALLGMCMLFPVAFMQTRKCLNAVIDRDYRIL